MKKEYASPEFEFICVVNDIITESMVLDEEYPLPEIPAN